jgi:hypothetical protein
MTQLKTSRLALENFKRFDETEDEEITRLRLRPSAHMILYVKRTILSIRSLRASMLLGCRIGYVGIFLWVTRIDTDLTIVYGNFTARIHPS